MVCPYSISVSAIINHTNMAATSHLNEARLFKVKSEFLLNLGIAMKKKLVQYQTVLRK